jgi:hypothetical protein
MAAVVITARGETAAKEQGHGSPGHPEHPAYPEQQRDGLDFPPDLDSSERPQISRQMITEYRSLGLLSW